MDVNCVIKLRYYQLQGSEVDLDVSNNCCHKLLWTSQARVVVSPAEVLDRAAVSVR